jgi:hypothetical protein
VTVLTTLYKLPSPELLVGSADGPAAVLALANRVERELPQLRRDDYYSHDTNLLVGPGQQGVLFNVDITVAAIGWLDADFGAIVTASSGTATPAYGGFVRIRFGSTITREIRFHNHSATTLITAGGLAALPLITGQTTISCDVLLQNDSTSGQPIYGVAYHLGVRQYGAPATG